MSSLPLTEAPSPDAQGSKRPWGEARMLARVPARPGFPEGIAVLGDRFYVSGPATFGTLANGTPSVVLEYSLDDGTLLKMYPTQGEDLSREHANACIAFDGDGRLYVLNTQLGVYRLNLSSGQQELYAPLPPQLPPLAHEAGDAGPASAPPLLEALEPSRLPQKTLMNDIAFDAAGNAYITDSLQAAIWRVPPGGGAPRLWFRDRRLDSPYIGVNGIRLAPGGDRVYFTVSLDQAGQGWVYSLPRVDAPSAEQLTAVHHYARGEAPDGIAFGDGPSGAAPGRPLPSGRPRGSRPFLYVALAMPRSSGLSILDAEGKELGRLGNPPGAPLFPYDSPANLAFTGRGSALVTNHAFSTGGASPSQFTVLDVFLDDRGAPLKPPRLP